MNNLYKFVVGTVCYLVRYYGRLEKYYSQMYILNRIIKDGMSEVYVFATINSDWGVHSTVHSCDVGKD